MNCMKCGRETEQDNVFCQDCLQEMDKYPVQPGTVVLLPRRRESVVIKKTAKRNVFTAEEQISSLRKWVLILMFLLCICICAIALMFQPTINYIMDEHFPIGQNYSVTPNAAPTTPVSTE